MAIEMFGRIFSKRSDIYEHLKVSKSFFNKIIRGIPEEKWEDALNDYFRIQGKGENLTPPTREEVTKFLEGVKPKGMNVRLSNAPFYLAFVRSDLIAKGVISSAPDETTNIAELVYLWYKQKERERCDCGKYRKFNTITEGYHPTCGQKCELGHGLGRKSIRKKVSQHQLASIIIDLPDNNDATIVAAINSLREQASDKQFNSLVFAHEILGPWVTARSSSLPDDAGAAERIFFALNGGSPFCGLGKRRKFRRFSDGYLFCGKNNDCPCSAEAAKVTFQETISKDIPSGYVTINSWATDNELNVTTALRYAKDGRIPSITNGRYRFIHANHPKPEGDEIIKCGICGKTYRTISNTHLEQHGVTREEYQAKFPGASVSKDTAKRIGSLAVENLYRNTRNHGFGRSAVERAFAAYLREKGLIEGEDFIQQWKLPKGAMSIDFFLPKERIVVEIDGPHHWEKWPYKVTQGRTREEMFAQQQLKDRERDRRVKDLGFHMIRVRVRKSLNDVSPLEEQLREQNFPDDLIGATNLPPKTEA